jgi:hypothetical protein
MRRRLPVAVPFVIACCAALPLRAVEPSFTAEQLEFFETKVRPLLVRECFECHSGTAKEVKGSLRLDSRAAVLHGGDSGQAIVVGKPQDSNLIQAVRWLSSEMPPSGKLQPDEIAALEKWVAIGAPWPAEDQVKAAVPEGKTYDWPKLQAEHWAWRPVERPALPQVKNTAWPKNEIDLFVSAKLEAAGLAPNPPAEPRVLLRRLYLDLIGIPPTPEEVAAFDGSDKAFAAAVERLLESPQYGERWGRYWLDVARYSDGYGGFLDKAALPSAWRYRDWVVAALNADMPYDEFVRLQIAGDLVDEQHAVATGFLSLGPTYISDGGDPEATAQAKSETLDDRLDTVCRGLMAVTLACARCHDHRFDPLPQADYYSIAGVFNNTRAHEVPLCPPEEARAYEEFHKTLAKLEAEDRNVRSITRRENRDLTKEERARSDELKAQIAEMKSRAPKPFDSIHAVADAGTADMNIAIRGNLLRPGPTTPRRFLQIVAGANPPAFKTGSGRLELADAIVDPANPLTPRVIVNRVWQQHFGFGLVRTPSNFGVLGEKPSHPELLDWLAAGFAQGTEDRRQETGNRGQKSEVRGQKSDLTSDFRPLTSSPWSLKSLHRLIVTSAAYRQDSASRDDAANVDGDNRLLWRMNPRRLDVEAWRDSLLAATGELDLTMGGKSIDDIGASNRRTLYASISRNGDKFASDTFLRMFDFPVPRATSEGRTASVVPQQSLFLMNSPFMVARAKAFAQRLKNEGRTTDEKIKRAYLLLYGRPVTDEELKLGRAFVKSEASAADAGLNAWQQYAQVLLSAGETMYWE